VSSAENSVFFGCQPACHSSILAAALPGLRNARWDPLEREGESLPRIVILCGRPFFIGPTVCAACAEAAQTKAQPKERSRWERLCPELYQHSDIARLEGDLRRQGYDERWTRDVLGVAVRVAGASVNRAVGSWKVEAYVVALAPPTWRHNIQQQRH
jgi:hypothetical protein